ncbi:alcohol dehydrogenase catalytic domain-containing protein [Streptomyces afghaniensis]|uniref:alcohol dehydrogenase catalytic domain-containing protein n=1 Tax=Streptomyces afghaniensis TaxID=66865 RepID=UPI0037B12309
MTSERRNRQDGNPAAAGTDDREAQDMAPEGTAAPAMRIARYYDNRSVRVESMPRPVIADGEVLVRVMASGICGSDVLEWFRVPKSPRILGHEISGVVAESRTDAFAVGDRVVVRNQIPCGACHPCRHGHHAVCERQVEIEPGGMAEYVRVPAELAGRGLTPLPPGLSFQAGTLAEPLACTLHAQALARIEPHQCVVVLGCGVFGLLHVQVALGAGVERVIAVDKVDFRTDAARRAGAALVLGPDADLPSEVRRINDGRLADVVVLATGAAEALVTASSALARHGTLLLFGAPEPRTPVPLTLNELFWRRELTMVSSYGAGDVDLARGLELLEKGVVDGEAMITHNVPFAEVQRAFATVTEARDSLKVVLDLAP